MTDKSNNPNLAKNKYGADWIKATETNSLTLVKASLFMGANPNVQDEKGNTALIIAASNQNEQIISYLISSGADVNLQNTQGHSPLSMACLGSNMRIIKTLLEEIINGDESEQFDLTLPLIIATEKHNIELAKLFLKYHFKEDITDSDGNNLIHYGSFHNQPEIIKLFIDFGIKFNIKNKKGLSALEIAMAKNYQGVEKLLTDTLMKDPLALNKAVILDDIPAIIALTRNGINLEEKDIYQNTAFLTACILGKLEISKFLAKMGANIEAPNDEGSTAIILATYLKNKEIVEFLLENNANIFTTNLFNTSAFKLAEKSSPEISSLVLNARSAIFSKVMNDYLANEEEPAGDHHLYMDEM